MYKPGFVKVRDGFTQPDERVAAVIAARRDGFGERVAFGSLQDNDIASIGQATVIKRSRHREILTIELGESAPFTLGGAPAENPFQPGERPPGSRVEFGDARNAVFIVGEYDHLAVGAVVQDCGRGQVPKFVFEFSEIVDSIHAGGTRRGWPERIDGRKALAANRDRHAVSASVLRGGGSTRPEDGTEGRKAESARFDPRFFQGPAAAARRTKRSDPGRLRPRNRWSRD